MVKVLITGGAGYKGSHLVAALLEKDREVRIIENFRYGHDAVPGVIPNENFSFVKKDVRTFKMKTSPATALFIT